MCKLPTPSLFEPTMGRVRPGVIRAIPSNIQDGSDRNITDDRSIELSRKCHDKVGHRGKSRKYTLPLITRAPADNPKLTRGPWFLNVFCVDLILEKLSQKVHLFTPIINKTLSISSGDKDHQDHILSCWTVMVITVTKLTTSCSPASYSISFKCYGNHDHQDLISSLPAVSYSVEYEHNIWVYDFQQPSKTLWPLCKSCWKGRWLRKVPRLMSFSFVFPFCYTCSF